jgi:hypothetical protein
MAASQDSVNVGLLGTLGIAGLVFTYATVLALQWLYLHGQQREQAEKVLAVPHKAKQELVAAGQQRLSEYGWVDRETGQVHIPLAEAQRLLLEGAR